MIRVLLIFADLLVTAQNALSESSDVLICQNLTLFYALWKDAAFGKDPNKIEKAAWILSRSRGSYTFQRWPPGTERNSATWKGPVPQNAIGLVHTHPVTVDEKPSPQDVSVAKKLGLSIYIISNRGIWRVTADGQQKKQARPGWHEHSGCK